MSGTRQGCVRSFAFEFASGHQIPPHEHGWHQLLYATRGVMTVTTAAGAWTVPTHRGVWIPARVVHAIRMSGPVSMRTLYLARRLDRRLRGDCEVLAVTPLLRELVLRIVELGALDRRRPGERRLLDVFLDEIDGLPARALALRFPADPRALRVAVKLQADPASGATLNTLAAGSGASGRTLERLFEAETGLSFGRWRQQLRLARAVESLASGASVTTAAGECGYESLSAFIAAFRTTFGQTPGRYRAAIAA